MKIHVFGSETEQGIFEQVLKGELDFVSEPWPSISESAKDLVRRMLVRDPKRRLTAHQVLCECTVHEYPEILCLRASIISCPILNLFTSVLNGKCSGVN